MLELNTVHEGDCLELMDELDDSSIDLIVTDPPYFKVKNEAWDRQWSQPSEFLKWLDQVLEQFYRILKSNGSLYCFASPKMAARIECLIAERFEVLNGIRWIKPFDNSDRRHVAQIVDKGLARSFYPSGESIIFAEHYGADGMAKGEAGYATKCDELRGFVFEPLRKYFCGEFERAGMLNTEGKIKANVACGFSPSSGGMASRHYFSGSQWCLPTPEHYQKLRELLNSTGGQYLRREYEDLRREYEDLRRPFNVTAEVPYTDVWNFKTVSSYPGKHPCEKPIEMLEHIITASSREGATVLDCFAGSGNTGITARRLNRNFIMMEKDPAYCSRIRRRLEAETDLFSEAEEAA